jgi:hypothetical protein
MRPDPAADEKGDDMLGNRKGGTVLEERGVKDRARTTTQGSAQQVVRSIQRLGDVIPGRARPMTRKTTRSTHDQPTGWGTAAVIAAGALAGVIVGVATTRRRR